MEELLAEIRAMARHHKGRLWGSIIGIVFGLFIIWFGFFRAIFVCLCLAAGYIIGSWIDQGDVPDFIKNLWRR
ncbi:MAG: DUF2273 domain-containing protein [Limnochordia bacterium]|jgi:uncharacterized membrane protein